MVEVEGVEVSATVVENVPSMIALLLCLPLSALPKLEGLLCPPRTLSSGSPEEVEMVG